MRKTVLVVAMTGMMVMAVGCSRAASDPAATATTPAATAVETTVAAPTAPETTAEAQTPVIEVTTEAATEAVTEAVTEAPTEKTPEAPTEAPAVTEENTASKDLVVLDNSACKVVFKGAEDAGASEYSENSKCYNVTYEITNKLDRDVVCFTNQEVLHAGETMTVTDRYDTWYEKNTSIQAYSLLERVEGEDTDKVILTRGFGEITEDGSTKVAFNFAIPMNVQTSAFAVEAVE